MSQPGFANLPDFAKQKAVRRIINQTREVARETMLAKHPALIGRSVQQKRERVTVR